MVIVYHHNLVFWTSTLSSFTMGVMVIYHHDLVLLELGSLMHCVKVKLCIVHPTQRCKIYKTIILALVLCGCETWSCALMEGHRLRVYEKRLLRRIFGPNREEVAGGLRTLPDEELHNLFTSAVVIRVIK